MEFKNKIIKGDLIESLKLIPDNSFDFCFADPPYFMQIEEGKNYIALKALNLMAVMTIGINLNQWKLIPIGLENG